MTDSMPAAPAALSRGRHLAVMSTLILATVLASLDASFVPIAFPDLIDDLDSSTGIVVWVALGYLIAATGPMLFFARLGDRRGYTRLFWIGVTIYGMAMSACAVAPSVASLIGLRVVQGLGMAVFLPATFSIATRIYPPADRGRALGVLASANALGFILGPVFAGWLLDSYDWRALFYTRVPLVLLTIVMAVVALRPRLIDAPVRAYGELDFRGAAFLTLGIFGLLFGFNRLPTEDNHLDAVVWLVFAAGVGFLLAFVHAERRSASPLVQLTLYRDSPGFTRASIAFGVLFASFPAYLFILPLVLIAGMEFRAWDAGLLLGVVAIVTFVVSPWAGSLSDRFGEDLLCSVGAASTLMGYLLLLGVRLESGAGFLIVPMIFFGIGSGLFFSPNNRLLMSSVPPDQAGMASGMIGTVRQTGYAIGFAAMASLFTLVQDSLERRWTRSGVGVLDPERAHELTEIFEAGGIWAPEVLLYVLHLGAILGATLLLISLIYSLPGLVFNARRHALTWALAAFVAILGGGLFIGATTLTVDVGERAGVVSRVLQDPPSAPSPFGLPSRDPLEVSGPQPVSLSGGRSVFAFYCADCHGADGRGIAGRGVDLVSSSFIGELDDAQLIGYLREGRSVDDPRNRTGQAMPGMRMFADFSNENYFRVVAYLRDMRGEPSQKSTSTDRLDGDATGSEI